MRVCTGRVEGTSGRVSLQMHDGGRGPWTDGGSTQWKGDLAWFEAEIAKLDGAKQEKRN
jgi:hypothetical protein